MKCMCTVFAMLLIFISVTAPVAANEAEWMPDANLRSAVRSALSIADDDALTQQAMRDLTSLTATNSEISNITGLEHATNLTSLDIRDNAITDATPLSTLTTLELLRLKGNTVSDMSALSGLTNLTVLNLRLTGISSVSTLSGLTNLEHLRVDDNSITDVEPLTSLTNLQRLWIAGNELTNAHLLSSLTNLTRLDITIPDPPDTTAPDVSISVPSEVQTGAFDVVITFTEVVSDFLQSDVSLGGTATASITDWDTTDNTVFTATITPTTSGTVTLDIAADVVTDAANNPNTAALTQTVTVVAVRDPQEPIVSQQQGTDTVAPDVSISVPSEVQNSAFFDVTITFTEVVSGFEQADLSISGTASASIAAWDTKDNTVFTATITPTTSGTVIFDVATDVATDAANNANTAATQKTVTVDFDVPTVSISVPSDTQTDAFDATITFSEAVSNFVQADVSLSGTATASITDWGTTDNTVYTATITPTTSGTVILDVAADVATDTANNPNTAATPKTVTVTIVGEGEDTDTVAPDVSISVPSEVQTGAFDVVITFTEVVSGFLQSDVSLGGTATASITDWNTTDNTVFTATITPTTSGEVTLDIDADVATDAASNGNTAATQQTVTMDVDAPTVVISVPSEVQNGAFDVIITFTEAVSGFEEADLSLGGTAIASITDWNTTDNTVFTAEITPTTSGEVTLDIDADVATDAASNGNTAAPQQTVVVDIDAPSVTLTLLPEVEGNRIDVQITFSEPVEGFESTDVLVTTNGLTQLDPTVIEPENGLPGGTIDPPPIASITGWTPSSAGSTYTVYITTYTQTEGQVIINVPADVAMDSVGYSNTASSELSVDEMPEGYLFVFSQGPFGWSNEDPDSGTCHLDFDFDKYRENLDVNKDGSINAADVALVEAALGQSGEGIINARTDINCDDIVDDTDLALVDDTTPPTVSVTVPTTPQSTSPFKITIRFSEKVTDFDVSDLSLEGSTATATITQSGRGGHSAYYFTVTPTTSGDLVISVPAGVAEDALGNLNTVSTAQTVSIDLGIPSVSSLTSTYPTVGTGVFTITITFSEEVSGFVQEDLRLSGSANPSVTAWESTDNIVFTATVTPTSSGSVRYYVPAGVATDTDDNSNTVSKKYIRNIDLDAPTVTVSVPTETQTGAFDVTIKFNESVYDFEQTDVSLADSTAEATITDWEMVSPTEYWVSGKGKIEPRSVYEATITPTTSGTVVVSIPADVCRDTAGNNNTASETHTVTIDLAGGGNAPSAVLSRITDLLDTTPLASLDLEQLEEQLQTLRVQSDGSAEYLQAIALLESTLAALRPEKTVLLANYPNPFNPETWIPYQLAAPSRVSITIYDARGTLVRQLDLGHQREGYYTSRGRAAYWDGRNEFGERVASGLYFYQLEADSLSLLRKMLILK